MEILKKKIIGGVIKIHSHRVLVKASKLREKLDKVEKKIAALPL